MKALILAGGLGNRMGNITEIIPKSMIRINKKPVIEYQIELLKKYGLKEIIICTGHLSKDIEDYFKDGNNFGIKITYSKEDVPLGTGGAIKKLNKYLKEDFLVLNGDLIINMDLKRLIDYHKNKKSIATVVIHPNDHPFDSDLVLVDKKGRITSFVSHSCKKNFYYRNLTIAGVYIFSIYIFKYMKGHKKISLEKEILPAIVSDKKDVYGYISPEYIKDMGTPERLDEVLKDINNTKVERFNLSVKNPAVFLDRDGVINELIEDINNVNDFKLMPNVPQAIKNISEMGFYCVVVTNQPSIAKGYCGFNEIHNIHNKMETLLGYDNAKLDAIYFCPHHPEIGFEGENKKYKVRCNCRKPKIGMIKRAKNDLNIDIGRSYLIGDSTVDLETARNGGLVSIGLKCGYGCKDNKFNISPDYWADDLYNAVELIKLLEKNLLN